MCLQFPARCLDMLKPVSGKVLQVPLVCIKIQAACSNMERCWGLRRGEEKTQAGSGVAYQALSCFQAPGAAGAQGHPSVWPTR